MMAFLPDVWDCAGGQPASSIPDHLMGALAKDSSWGSAAELKKSMG
jgi:hypothetical protein